MATLQITGNLAPVFDLTSPSLRQSTEPYRLQIDGVYSKKPAKSLPVVEDHQAGSKPGGVSHYIGHLVPPNSGGHRVKVFVKFTTNSSNTFDLEREATIYRLHLPKLQGKIVPRCYGYFNDAGHCRGKANMGCLILEYLETGLLPKIEVYVADVFRVVKELHIAGIEHGRLNEDHVVQTADGVKLVGFTTAARHCDDGKDRGTESCCREMRKIHMSFGVISTR